MGPLYRQGEVYPRPLPAYFSAPPNVEPQPIWLEPREPQPHHYYRETQPHYYYRETPKRPWPDQWSYNEGRPYLSHYPAEGGYYYCPPQYRNSPPRFYDPDGMDFGRERFYDPEGREFCRDFRPIYVYPSSSALGPYSYRPFHPGEQFRHPDEYPMRFVPVSYGPAEQSKAHCCGCPNHVCHPETKTMKEIERKQITEGQSVGEMKPKFQNLQEFPGPVVVLPSVWRNTATSPERKDHVEEKENHPVYWIPAYWNGNDREPGRDRKGEDKEPSPACWYPVNYIRNDRTREHDPRIQGYLTPLTSNTSTQDENENKKDAAVEGKLHPFPLIWIPEGRYTNTQEESKSSDSQANCEDTKKTNGVESRPVILQEIGKDDEKQGPAEIKKEIKARVIPVKQLEKAESQKEEEKSSQSQKTHQKVGEKHHKTSSPRASKLPPVCLRVDPLPGKKKSNGKSSSSRSPSPPRKSENPKESATSSVSMEEKKSQKNAKMNASNDVEEKLDASTKANVGIGKPEEDVKLDDSKVGENENMQSKKAEVKKRELSRDHAAALKIQACYRGYQVRRLQPLRKLHEIAKIREQVEELKKQISSPEFVGEFSRDEKVKGRTHETLMGLLLQLDTILGLHPVVRDVRKAVARELVLLQEKLDTWTEVGCNNNMQQQQSCLQESTKNNVRVEEEIIDKRDKDWEATEDFDNMLNSNIENQQVDIEASKDEEKAHEKQDSLEVEKETSDEDRKETSVEEEKSTEEKREATINDGEQNVVVEQKDCLTEYGKNVQGNALLNQEALEISENVDIPALPVVEMGNRDKDADILGQMISTPYNTLENINEDKEYISEETISVSNAGEVHLEKAVVEEKSEPQTNIDSQNVVVEQEDYATGKNVQGNALLKQEALQISENDVETSALPVVEMGSHKKDADLPRQMISTPDNSMETTNEDKEQLSEETASVSNSGEVYLENMKAEEEGKSEPQMNIDSVDMQTEVSPLPTLVQQQEMSDGGNSTNLHQSTGEKAFQGEVVVGVPEAEHEIEILFSEANETENEDLQNVVTEEIVGDKHPESNQEVSSWAISDIASGSRSDGHEENNLVSLKTNSPVEDNSSGKRESAASLAQETYDLVNHESVQIPTTGDDSDVNFKDELSTCNVESQKDDAPKCSGLSDDMELRASETEDKFVMELFSPANDPHHENLSQSEANRLQYGSKENEEKWEEENEKLREMVEKLVESGKQQMSTIAQLNKKIKSLESKLGKGNGKKKARARQLKLKRNIVSSKSKNASDLKEI